MSTLLPIALLLAAMICVQAGASIAKTLFPVTGPIGMVAVRIALGTIILCIVMRRLVDFCWIVLACAGLTLLLPVAHIGVGTDPLGALCALAAGGCWALYIVYGQKAGADHGAHAAALGSVISAIVVMPIGLIDRGHELFSGTVLIPGLFVAILSTALPYTLEMVALTRLPARTFGVLMSIEPAFGALVGYLYLNEWLTGVQWTAIALVILASIGATASSQQRIPVGAAG